MYLTHKTVLVTGAGGSIGSALVEELIKNHQPKKLVFLDIGEYNLYQLQNRVQALHSEINFTYLLADIRHTSMLEKVFDEHQPEVVFHVAALKHVPMLEIPSNTMEAIRTNIIGTKNVADCAIRHNAQMVHVSTDKAVNPVSMMGSTKTFAEGYVREAYTKAKGKASIVRFGNVIGSSGSVIPLFEQQIAQGGPVTVTHPDIIRYFMTIEEAVHLVVEAATIGAPILGAHTFVLDMGDPIRIDQLAKDLIGSLGEGKDIPIEYIGLREGEKMHEELHYDYEYLMTTSNDKVSMVSRACCPYYGYWNVANELVTLCEQRNLPDAFERIKNLVPYKGDTIMCASL